MNRDPAKVLVLGHDEPGFATHPENFIPMDPWTPLPTKAVGSASPDPAPLASSRDYALEHALDFLEQLAFSRLSDLRPVIKASREDITKTGKKFPFSFDSTNETVFEVARQSRIATKQARASNPVWNFFFGSFGRTKKSSLKKDLDGNGGDVLGKQEDVLTEQSPDKSSPFYEPSYWERKQERIELRRKEFAHIKGLMMKQLEAEMAKEKEFYEQNKTGVWDMLSRRGAPPTNPSASEGTAQKDEASDGKAPSN